MQTAGFQELIGKGLRHLAGLLKKLLTLTDAPTAIAGGAAIGMFVGFLPLWGIKTLLCIGLATLLRRNAVAAVLAVSLHDVLTPLAPRLMRVQYDIGFFLLSRPHHLPEKFEVHHLKVTELFQWTTFLNAGLPIMIGAILFAIPAGAITYAATLYGLKAFGKTSSNIEH